MLVLAGSHPGNVFKAPTLLTGPDAYSEAVEAQWRAAVPDGWHRFDYLLTLWFTRRRVTAR